MRPRQLSDSLGPPSPDFPRSTQSAGEPNLGGGLPCAPWGKRYPLPKVISGKGGGALRKMRPFDPVFRKELISRRCNPQPMLKALPSMFSVRGACAPRGPPFTRFWARPRRARGRDPRGCRRGGEAEFYLVSGSRQTGAVVGFEAERPARRLRRLPGGRAFSPGRLAVAQTASGQGPRLRPGHPPSEGRNGSQEPDAGQRLVHRRCRLGAVGASPPLRGERVHAHRC
jgi:hypothetical protein